MSWSRRSERGFFPPDMLERLSMLARYEMDRWTSGLDGGDVYGVAVVPFLGAARADPDAFVARLRALVAGDRRGFPTVGASCLVVELLDSEALRSPDGLVLLDGAIEVKRDRGLSTASLTGYEHARWIEVNGYGTW
jgi:hypothetical protein